VCGGCSGAAGCGEFSRCSLPVRLAGQSWGGAADRGLSQAELSVLPAAVPVVSGMLPAGLRRAIEQCVSELGLRGAAEQCFTAGLLLYWDLPTSRIRFRIRWRGGNPRTADYWHGIMHCREPDARDASYWFRRVG
jgi:hypothetical protein